ncbi:MAG: hypothetical protein KDC05_08570 [Bacteroidales bacterium]|nr:hypothetical protein [Bacteroidales bacterium]
MKKQTLNFVLSLLLIIFLLPSCIEKELDFDGIKSQNWNSEWALPLVNSSLGITDLLNDSVEQISEDENGLISLVYESQNLVSLDASEIAEIPDQFTEISENFDLPDNIPAGLEGTVPVQFKIDFKMDEEDIRLDSVILKSGTYDFLLRTNLDKDITGIDFEIPNMVHLENGETLSFTLDVDPQGGSEISKDTLFNLDVYKIIFENTFADTNKIYINALVHFVADDNPPNNPYYIILENNFQNMDFLKYFGYAGYRTINFSDTIKLNIFDVNQEGNFEFADGSVNLNLNVSNSFGMPVLLDVSKFTAYHGENDQDSLEIYLFGEGVPAEIELNYPNLQQIGESVLTTVEADNSNMNEALGIAPNKLFIGIDGYLNPDQNPDIYNFILDSSRIRIDMDVELRLFGAVNSFVIADTVDFELESLDEIEQLTLVTLIENGFPINADVQLYFVDSLFQVTHELLTGNERLIVAGQVGGAPDYRVNQSADKLTEIVFAAEDIERISDARKILINATLSTGDGELVKIYSDYELKVKLGARIGLKL